MEKAHQVWLTRTTNDCQLCVIKYDYDIDFNNDAAFFMALYTNRDVWTWERFNFFRSVRCILVDIPQLHCRFTWFPSLSFFIFIPVSRTIVFFSVASLSVLYSLLFFLFSFSVGISSSSDQKFIKWTETQTIRILIEESWLGNFDFMDRLIKIRLLDAICWAKNSWKNGVVLIRVVDNYLTLYEYDASICLFLSNYLEIWIDSEYLININSEVKIKLKAYITAVFKSYE